MDLLNRSNTRRVANVWIPPTPSVILGSP
jgi:hypothetical protein